jgi:type II restriction/modification system DNA methylase subunit YeeA
MNLNILKPRQVLNKAFLKVKTSRSNIETFKKNLIQLIDTIKETESEEFHKNLVSDFLKNTWYGANHFINTKGRNDLVIHNTNSASGTVGVIIEAKSPVNKAEMIKPDNINTKALQELVLYYLRERITHKNLEVKHLIATNIYEWYIFDANTFEKEFAQNKALVKQFTDFEEGRLAGKNTDFFYKEIAQPAINAIQHEFSFTRFDIRDYNKALRNADKADDTTLIALYKLLAPEHLLKLPFANDSNSLDKTFYSELLHIIGLTEIKDGGKKLIQRKKEGERDAASLLENTIIQLESHDKITRLTTPSQYGDNHADRLFNVALELVITWMNRVLFLKLLEAQLISYHKGDKQFAFLNNDKIKDFDDLDKLFFRVLARKVSDRDPAINQIFGKVPYLNSSLFEPTELEHQTIFISGLEDFIILPFISSTVIKDNSGKKSAIALNTLQYLFEFLNAYDFSSEGSEEIRDDNKSLINASVLGLIFEKINGYKDGSFFTPGFITMYMCRETIRRTVIQKFNDTKNWNCDNLEHLYDKIDNREEANSIINSITICDPAVGSGHFLVSALNEIIAIKSELKVLTDRQGKRLKEYNVTVENDELIITDDEGQLFVYNPRNPESQRIQETLFHEKQTIIENCLFGVDLNPNSVKICRLRLWIELLKNAYYKAPDFAELETLPNIDINIKCGNSLISRYTLDADIKKALTGSTWDINSYRIAVMSYRNAKTKEEKRELERLINTIKNDFESKVSKNDKRFIKLAKARGLLMSLTNQTSLFERSKSELAKWNKEVNDLNKTITDLDTEIEQIKSNRIYENAFEWRFEFPEVLNDDGDFIGFDAVIGNPPYIRQEELGDIKPFLSNTYKVYAGTADILVYFFELSLNILRTQGIFSMITSNKFIKSNYGKNTRNHLAKYQIHKIIDFGELPVFDEAATFPVIIEVQNLPRQNPTFFTQIKSLNFSNLSTYISEYGNFLPIESFNTDIWSMGNIATNALLDKMNRNGLLLGRFLKSDILYGIKTGFNKAFVIDEVKREELIKRDPKSTELIYPYVIGDDIRFYHIKNNRKYIIITKIGVAIENYPAIYEHLLNYKEELEKRWDKGNHWYELRACAYYEDFKKPKLIFPDIAKESRWTFCQEPLFIGNTAYFIPCSDLSLLGVMNSRAIYFYFSQIASVLGDAAKGGRLRWFAQDVVKIPIPILNDSSKDTLKKLVFQILELKKQSPIADTSTLESDINQLVYQLYNLTDEEIQIIETN